MPENKMIIINRISSLLNGNSNLNTRSDYQNIIANNNELLGLLKKLFDDVENDIVNIDYLQNDMINPLVKELILFYIEENNYKIDISNVDDSSCEKNGRDIYLSDNQVGDYLKEIDSIPLYTNEEKMKVFPKHKEIRELNKKIRVDIISAYYNILLLIAEKYKAKNLDFNNILIYEIELLHDDIKKNRFITDKNELKLYLIKKVGEYANKKKTGRNLKYDFTPYENSILSIDEVPNLYKKHSELYKSELDIRNDIVKHNMRLVVKKAYEYKKKYPTQSLLDLINDGMEGLINILDNDFDYELSSLMTYSYEGLDYKLRRSIERNEGPIRISSNMRLVLNKYNLFINSFLEKNNRYPTNDEICKELSITKDRLYDLNQANNVRQLVSLDEPLKNSDDDDAILADFIKDNNSIEDEIVQNDTYEKLLDELYNFNDLTKLVLMARFGFVPRKTLVVKKSQGVAILSNHPLYSSEINKFLDNKLEYEVHDKLVKHRFSLVKIRSDVNYIETLKGKPITLDDVGKLLFCSRERIRQIELKALKVLRSNKKIIKIMD